VYRFIQEQSHARSVRRLCRTLKVSPSAFYRWQAHPVSARGEANLRLLDEIRSIYEENRRVYGSPRIVRELRDNGVRCGHNRVARLMREHSIQAKTTRRFRVTTRGDRFARYAPDRLARRFTIDLPNRVWVSDITYIWSTEGWSYLAEVLDLYSRRVVGWELGERITADLITTALSRALRNRVVTTGLVVHSDRGSQYVSERVQGILDDHRCLPSHGQSCYDNAVAESFFHTIKGEHLRFERFSTREELRTSLFEYIEMFYNRRRRHSTLGMVSPVEFEKQHAPP
jgi:putative transposase